MKQFIYHIKFLAAISGGAMLMLAGVLNYPVKVDQETHKLISPDGSPAENQILLTIDDSPMARSTGKILEILDRHDVPALFFINGYLIENQPGSEDLIKKIDRKGHLVGNHTWNHSNLAELDSTETFEEINSLQEKIEELIGYKPYYFRPPYGDHNDYLRALMDDMNMQSMNWSAMSFDWNYKDTDDPDEIVELTMQQVHHGANILFHDRKISAKAVDRVIEKLHAEGYEFVLPDQN